MPDTPMTSAATEPVFDANGGDGSYLPGRCLCEPDEYVCDACCVDGAWHDRNC